jgi:hypothetical protein
VSQNARAWWTTLRIVLVALVSSGCGPRRVDAALPPNSLRWALSPSAIASLSSDHDTLGVPAEIRLGDPLGRSALYLKFPNDWRQQGRILQAFLTLTPSDGAVSDDSPISVEAWRIKSDWQPAQLHAWSDKPELGPPYARCDVPSTPPRALRIDVSELVRFAASDPQRDFGLALLSRGGQGRGMAFASGMSGGHAPELDVYLP